MQLFGQPVGFNKSILQFELLGQIRHRPMNFTDSMSSWVVTHVERANARPSPLSCFDPQLSLTQQLHCGRAHGVSQSSKRMRRVIEVIMHNAVMQCLERVSPNRPFGAREKVRKDHRGAERKPDLPRQAPPLVWRICAVQVSNEARRPSLRRHRGTRAPPQRRSGRRAEGGLAFRGSWRGSSR